MIIKKAYLLDGATTVFSIEDVNFILNDIREDWMRYGCCGELVLPTVQEVEFIGYIDEHTKAPIGQVTTRRGEVFQVNEHFEAELVSA